MIESVRVLSTLKSMDDFVELAKKDMELALRLMEYRDFTEAPLFKDLRIRTIYEGLRGTRKPPECPGGILSGDGSEGTHRADLIYGKEGL